MGGSTQTNSSSDSNYQNVNMIPQWVQNAGQQNYALAQDIAQQPLQQYQGQMVADISPQTQQAWNLAAQSGNVGQDQYQGATAGYLSALGNTPININAAQSALANPTNAMSAALANPVSAAQAATAQAAAAQQSALAAPTQASTANLSTLRGMNLNPYLSPYTQDVINKTLPIMNQSLQQQQNAIQNQANSANAFGGSRQGIEQGVMGAQGAQSEAQMAAQLNNANYAQAQQAGMYDVGQANNMGQFNANQLNQVGMYNQGQANQVGMFNAGQGNQVNLANAQMANAANQFNAGQSNQVNLSDMAAANAQNQFNAQQGNQVGMYNQGQANQMGQFNAGQANTVAQANQAAQAAQVNANINAATGLSNVGMNMGRQNAADFSMLSSAGAQQQQQAQNDINAQIAKFQQAYNNPQNMLGVLESSLGMTPYNTAQAGTQSSQSQSETQQTPDMASLALGGLQSLGSLFGGVAGGSDRKIKKNIQHLGKDPITGVPIKAFNYKGDPARTPKTIGPLAQDIEKRAPGSTVKIGGIMRVPASTLAAATPTVANHPMHSSKRPRVPGGLAPSDTVPAMLTPGEAVLTPPAANAIGRGKIAAANAAAPPVRGYAAGTAFVPPPSVLPFAPRSSPGVAKGIAAMTAFTPQVRMPRGLMVPHAGALRGPRPRVRGGLG